MTDFSGDNEGCFIKKLNSVNTGEAYQFGRPIFILGTAKRSGTNYLKNMLCLHPDCFSPGPVWEDFILLESSFLSRYVDCTFKRWNPDWKVGSFLKGKPSLLGAIGDGILQYLHQQFYSETAQKNKINKSIKADSKRLRLITKTPSVQNIENFFEIFPDAYLIVITRDGRAVTESTSKSFNKPFNIAIQEWKNEAKILGRFVKGNNFREDQCCVVKYEDILSNSREELTKILKFIGLSVNSYDFEKVDNAPVIGSSELSKDGPVHWNGVPKDKGFDPSKRWKNWGRWKHARFNWVVGCSQEDLGYSLEKQSLLFIIPNIILDSYWILAWKLWKLVRNLKYRLS